MQKYEVRFYDKVKISPCTHEGRDKRTQMTGRHDRPSRAVVTLGPTIQARANMTGYYVGPRFILPAKAREYVFTGVGLCVCPCVCVCVCVPVCLSVSL